MKHNYIKNMLAAMLLLCSTVASAYDFKVGGIYYNITYAPAKTVEVSRSPDDSYSGDVVIPDKVTYNGTTYSVTSIGGSAFSWCRGLTSVTIGSGVTSIGNSAFDGCSGLTAVHINDLAAWCRIDVSAYSSNPLYYAHNLYLNGKKVTDLVIPNSVTSIGSHAFDGCSGLTSVTIPNSVTSIGSYAFRDCTGLTSITIPNSVTSIGADAFYGCSGLTSITIPNSVNIIGNNAFNYCSGLTSVTIGNSVSRIGDSAFSHCSGLTSITVNSGNRIYDSRGCNAIIETATNRLILGCKNTKIPNSVTTIGYNAFNGCTGLTNIKIPDSVTSIGEAAFYNCTGLTSITIPNSVTSIGKYAFEGCTGLTSIAIPNSVTSIGDYAFRGCSGLTSITIPNSVTSIGHWTFCGCTGLTSIEIPNSVTSIGQYAFIGCSGLTGIIIYSGSIDSYAFEDCTKLASVTIGEGVTSIESKAFYGCENLKTVYNYSSLNIVAGNTNNGYVAYYADKVINARFDESDFVFDIIDGVNTLIEYTGDGGDITLPEKYYGKNYVIGSSAFYGCSRLTSVTIPNGVTSIGDYAFYNCTGLTSIEIPNSVTSIGKCAFECCTGLTSVTIGNSVTSIGDYAFSVCTDLASVTIGNSVTIIGEKAFYGCTGLTAVHINDLAAWCRIDFCGYDSNPLYYAHLYLNGEKVTDLVIPNSVTSIGIWAFAGCSELTSVTIGNSVTSIGTRAFNDCTSLASVTIGNSVTSIGNSAFAGCTYLKTVYNCSSLNIVKGSTDNGYVAYYADKVIYADSSGNGVIGDYKFTSANGVNTLVEYLGDGGDITLPENCNGENYVIGANAFKNNTAITGVTIPAGVTAIGDNAFYGCENLKTVTNNSSLNIVTGSTDNGSVAYYADKVITINADGSSYVIIGDYKFTSANGVNTLVGYLGNKITLDSWTSTNAGENSSTSENTWTINAQAGDILTFDWRVSSERGYDKLIVTIDGGEILNESGEGSDNYTHTFENAGTYTLVARYTKDYSAQKGDDCASISNVKIASNGNASIALVLPENYNGENYVIGANAFKNNTAITGVTIPAGVTAIGDNAFYGCENLKTVINNSSLNIVAGSTDNGYVAYYADKVITINADGSSNVVIGDYKFTSANGVNTLVEYLRNKITLDSWTSTNAGENSSTSENTWTINAQAGDILTFDWRVSSERDYDKLIVTIDGSEILNESGEGSGNYTHTFENAGTYTLVARYTKDHSAQKGDDCASISNVKIASNENASIALVLPENCNGENYVIGANAFKDNTAITGVTIPAGVTGIGDNAFYGCENLKTVINNSSLNIVAGSTDNGYVAYYADKVINIPNGFIEGDFVFARTEVTSLQFTTADGLPGTVTGSNRIWESPVINSSTNGVRITVFATNVTDSYNNYPIVALGELEFYDGNGNKIAYSASNVTTNSLESTEGSLSGLCDGDYSTFYHSTWRNGTTPDDYVYLDIKFPQTVDAFKIKMVGRNTQRCVPTEIRVTLSKYSLVDYIGDDTALVLPENCNGDNYVIGANVFRNNTAITSVTIPDGVTSIGNTAFYYCQNLTSVKLGKNVTTLGDYAFQYCTSLNDITLPNSLQAIGKASLSHCGFTNVVIPNKVKTIGDYAFDYCENLAQVTIGNSVTSIGDNAFYGCENLKTVTNNSSLNIVAGSTDNGYVAYYADKVINADGSSNVFIGDYKFTSANGVNTLVEYLGDGGDITLPENYNGENYVIGANAFEDCTGLTNVTIPNSVTNIGDHAFRDCTGLTNVTIPNSVTSIGFGAFRYCDGLTSIEIPGSVTSIGEYAFDSCTGLTAVHINDLAAWCRIYFSNDYSNPLFYAHNLYLNGEKVTDLVIPNSVTSIGDYAFSRCSGLTSVTIPNSVTSIGEYAFRGCTRLKEIYSLAKTPPTIDSSSTFDNYTATLYVPYGTKSAYQAADYWKNFTNIVEMEPEFTPGDINSDDEVNVGDFAALVNVIFASEVDEAQQARADINEDGEVNVGDFAALVNVIFGGSSNAAPKKAAATRATTGEHRLYIEPFSIAPGERAEIAVLMENTGDKFSQMQFDLTLPEGISIVQEFDEELFGDVPLIKHGSRTSSKAYDITCRPEGDGVKIMCATENINAYFLRESGDVLLITVEAAADLAFGTYELTISNSVLARQDDSTYKPASETAEIAVCDLTGIDSIEAEDGAAEIYDIYGRRVTEPVKGGVYIINGKKVVVNK